MSTVPAILKYLKIHKTMHLLDQNTEMPIRAKKRRLDHLTWEEKMQRKKLKNRVAAQTSRDRKKAKMEHMESALQELFMKNETLLAECENLKDSNKRLQEENAELMSRLRGPCVHCSQSWSVEPAPASGSTGSFSQLQGTGTSSAAALNQQTTQALWKIVLACLLYQTSSMSSTVTSTSPALNSSLRAYSKISPKTWKQLLRRQIVKTPFSLTRDLLELESSTLPTNTKKKESYDNTVKQVVGQTSEELESNGSQTTVSPGDDIKRDEAKIKEDLSQFLLLHHNYSAKPETQKTRSITKRTDSIRTKRKLKSIRPKVTATPVTMATLHRHSSPVLFDVTPAVADKIALNADLIVADSLEDSSCITLFVSDDGTCLNETGAEVVLGEDSDTVNLTDILEQKMDCLDVPVLDKFGSSSPVSDHGYESLGSPVDASDLWDESVSELFPSLI